MRRVASLPAEMQGLDVQYLNRVSAGELSGSCPRCGGSVHRDGTYPDRFRIFLHSRVTGGLLGWCRKCGYTWTPGRESDVERVERPERDYEAEAEEMAAKNLTRFLSQKNWEKYHDALTDDIRAMYHARMIDDYWVDYWMLGYCENKTVWRGAESHVTPSLTIPMFLPLQESPVNIRHRLINPATPDDKYRPEFGGLPSALFYTDRDKPPGSRVLVIEGEFKAMTAYIALDDPGITVVGLPGKKPNEEIFAPIAGAEVVYLWLDPDAYVLDTNNPKARPAVERLAGIFGDRARIIRTPYKPDDMIVKGWIDKTGIRALLAGAYKW